MNAIAGGAGGQTKPSKRSQGKMSRRIITTTNYELLWFNWNLCIFIFIIHFQITVCDGFCSMSFRTRFFFFFFQPKLFIWPDDKKVKIEKKREIATTLLTKNCGPFQNVFCVSETYLPTTSLYLASSCYHSTLLFYYTNQAQSSSYHPSPNHKVMRARGGSRDNDTSEEELYSDGWVNYTPYKHKTSSVQDDTEGVMDEELHKKHATNGKALPGRPRRRRRAVSETKNGNRGKPSSQSFCYQFYAKWIQGCLQNSALSSNLLLAVLLWYCLGVVSITSSKILLTPAKVHFKHPRYYHHVGGVPPLYLTLQQLFLGSCFLRTLLSIRFLNSPGVQPWSFLRSNAVEASKHPHHYGSLTERSRTSSLRSPRQSSSSSSSLSTILPRWLLEIKDILHEQHARYLFLSAACFAFGFLATNWGFNGTSAAFVETIKAAEPITSAALAVLWKLETLTQLEVSSLASIVAGVVLSTVGNVHAPSTHSASSSSSSWMTSLTASITSCTIVMISNLCFSFRGLFQKLFRVTHPASRVDDVNLQFRMQQIGVCLLALPVLQWDVSGMVYHCYKLITTSPHHVSMGVMIRYVTLALMNGIAFTSYK